MILLGICDRLSGIFANTLELSKTFSGKTFSGETTLFALMNVNSCGTLEIELKSVKPVHLTWKAPGKAAWISAGLNKVRISTRAAFWKKNLKIFRRRN